MGLLKIEGVVGMGIVAWSLLEAWLEIMGVGASEIVALLDAIGAGVGVLGIPEETTGDSEAGIVMLPEETGLGVGTAPVGTVPDEGTTPDGVAMAEGVAAGADGVATGEDGTTRVSLGTMVGMEDTGVGTAPDGIGVTPEGVGTMPDGVGTAEGLTPEEISVKMLEAMLATGGITMGPLADGTGTRLETMLGITETGRSETADESRLEMSTTKETC